MLWCTGYLRVDSWGTLARVRAVLMNGRVEHLCAGECSVSVCSRAAIVRLRMQYLYIAVYSACVGRAQYMCVGECSVCMCARAVLVLRWLRYLCVGECVQNLYVSACILNRRVRCLPSEREKWASAVLVCGRVDYLRAVMCSGVRGTTVQVGVKLVCQGVCSTGV